MTARTVDDVAADMRRLAADMRRLHRSRRRRAWLVDLLTALIVAHIVGAIVLFAGGPAWAAIGLGLIVYLQHPLRRQAASR